MLKFVISGAIAGVPGGLVVDQDMNMVATGGAANGERVFERDGERLLNHDGDAILRGDFDGMAVFADGGIHQHRLRPARLNHVGHALEVESFRESELAAVLGEERGIGVGDANQVHIAVLGQRVEEALDVAMLQADNGDAEGRLRGKQAGQCEERRDREQRRPDTPRRLSGSR